MVAILHLNLVLVLILVFTKSILSQPISESERKPTFQDMNENDLRYLIAKTLSRHPLGILGHIIIEAVDKAGMDGPLKGKQLL